MNNSFNILSAQQMLRTNEAHIGSSPIISTVVSKNNKQVSNDTAKSAFSEYLLDAVNYVNDKQQASTDMTEKLITDPDSVDAHDVTIAMAEANLSLTMAQTVIDRLTKAWNEITTTR